MQLFYNAEISEENRVITFSKEESRHIVKVLRKSVGDTLQITNGQGWLFSAEIISADAKYCKAEIKASNFQLARNYNLHLAVAPTKMNDRYEWFLEKATEIGIDEITPIITKNSERRVIKKERFERVLQSALKQSLNCYLPKLNGAMSLTDFLKNDFKGQQFIAHCEETDRKSLKNQLIPQQDVTILIGPEGDFDNAEIALAQSKGFYPITLGESRLRTETAALVACHSVAFINQPE